MLSAGLLVVRGRLLQRSIHWYSIAASFLPGPHCIRAGREFAWRIVIFSTSVLIVTTEKIRLLLDRHLGAQDRPQVQESSESRVKISTLTETP